jgi:hypothetical protein
VIGKAVSQGIKTRFIAAADIMLQLVIARKQERLNLVAETQHLSATTADHRRNRLSAIWS